VASKYKNQTKTLKLNLSNVSNKEKVKRDIGEFIVNEMLLKLSDGKSPVAGEKFNKLSDKYASEEKGGDTTPNLELEGDMLDALGFKSTKGSDELVIGILDEKQWGKADGHNKFGKTNNKQIPKRRFIPLKSGKFEKSIMNGVKQIISANKKTKSRQLDGDVFKILSETSQEVGIALESILDEDLIEELLG
jgi:hypothetical protein